MTTRRALRRQIEDLTADKARLVKERDQARTDHTTAAFNLKRKIIEVNNLREQMTALAEDTGPRTREKASPQAAVLLEGHQAANGPMDDALAVTARIEVRAEDISSAARGGMERSTAALHRSRTGSSAAAPAGISRFRPSRGGTPEEIRLRAALRGAKSTVAALTNRLTTLQDANERAYREQHDAVGGPRFDSAQPFGTRPRPVSLLHKKSDR